MSTEIEQYENHTLVPALPQQSNALSSIQQTAIELEAAHRIAVAICNTAFVPKHFQGKPEECAVAILYGSTVGFDPVTAVQQIYVISGKPALYARAMVAIVIAAGHKVWTEEESSGSVTVCGQRAGSDKVERVTWTSQLAQLAGYTSNAKYKTDPRSMLYARASGDVARRIAPDALLGMAYNVEEMELVGDIYVRPEPATSSSKDQVRAALGASKPVESEPASQPEATAAPAAAAEQPAAGGLTKAQSKKMHATFNELGITDRAARLAYASKVVGRQLGSSNELSKDEASDVIEALNVDLQNPPSTDDDTVDADIVEPDAQAIWEQIVTAAATHGMNRWDVETDFAQANAGATPQTASISELTTYLETMTTGEVAAS